MTTRNKMITGLALSTLLATGLFAGNSDMKNDRDSSCMMKKDHMQKGGKHGERSVVGIFKRLNLTPEQDAQIEKIVFENRANMQSIDDAFTKDGFDKDKYIKIMNEKRDNMLKSNAEILDKSYAVLTPKQKEQLKVLMDLRKEKMNKKL
jgi:Spy/CpxP family protein refolding chaperone